MAEVVPSTNPLNAYFKKAQVGNKLVKWYCFILKLVHKNLNEGINLFIWNLHTNGLFKVKSMYKHLVNNNTLLTKRLIIIYK